MSDENPSGPGDFRASYFGRLRVGQGVVGKAAYVAAAAILALGAIGWSIRDSNLAFVIACLIALLAIGSLWRIFKYADEHPESSLLEGAELIQWKQLEMAAKGILQPPIGKNIEPPKVIPPPSKEGE